MRKLQAEMTEFFHSLYVDDKKVLVFGCGNEKARLLLVGEAPGEQETLEGKPFVGRAGKNLDEFLRLSGIEREELYITNTVKFRPVKKSKAGRTVNRPPTREEIELNLPFLRREIALVAPKCVVTLGNVPLKALTENDNTIGKMHGQFFQREGYLLYPLYHPASVIYNPALREVYEEDVRRLGLAVREL